MVAARSISALQGAAVLAFALAIPFRTGPTKLPLLDVAVPGGIIVATVVLCLLAAWRERAQHRPAMTAWLLLAGAHVCVVIADARVGLSPVPIRGLPSIGWQDAVYLAYDPLVFCALWLLMRENTPPWLSTLWSDAIVVGLGSLALACTAISRLNVDAWLNDPRLDVNTLYPLADVVLLALILCIATVTGARWGSVPWWLSAGLALVAVSDAAYVWLANDERYLQGGLADLGWLVGYILIGTATWRPAHPNPDRDAVRREQLRRLRQLASRRQLSLLPGLFIGLSILVLAWFIVGGPVSVTAALLALGAVAAALLRAMSGWHNWSGAAGPLTAHERTDELTGLANRRALSEALASDGISAGRTDGDAERWSGWTDKIALLLVDLDRFKDINEALGHDAGDRVLAEVGARFQTTLRSPQLLARLGGDEFAVLLPGAGRGPATRVAAALGGVLAEPVEVDGTRLHVRASIGVATCSLPRGETADLLRQADVALNRAKAAGTGLEVYDARRDLRSPQRLRRIDELRSALERGDLEVYLQPQVHLVTGAVVGVEALARWRHPSDGVLLPDSFLPLAAQTGLMRPVAALVLDRALGSCASWWGRGHRIPVSVNLSADDLRDAGLSARIAQCLLEHQLPAAALRIEITEDVLLTDPDAVAALLEEWRDAGIAVALDDFGTGYSSLAYLRQLPLDELKLDQVFAADLRNRRTVTIVRHTVAMAHGLGLHVVAEGVEDQATARTLADVGCDIGQGLYFGAAMALPQFLEQLDGRRPRAART